MRARMLIVVAAAATALALAACGEEEETTAPPVEPESTDALPDLPSGWRPHVNHDSGVAVGVPPGWEARDTGGRIELRPSDQLAAVSIIADRTDEAVEAPLEELATARLSAGLPGIEDLEAEKPRPYRHRYEAVAVEATGTGGREGDVRERVLLVELRKDDLADFTVVAAVNAELATPALDGQIDELIASIRGFPVGTAPGGQRSGRSG